MDLEIGLAQAAEIHKTRSRDGGSCRSRQKIASIVSRLQGYASCSINPDVTDEACEIPTTKHSSSAAIWRVALITPNEPNGEFETVCRGTSPAQCVLQPLSRRRTSGTRHPCFEIHKPHKKCSRPQAFAGIVDTCSRNPGSWLPRWDCV